MIVQVTLTKNELFLLKAMLPHWQKYADGFVFYDDYSTDGTYEFLMENKEKYNILEVLRGEEDHNYTESLRMETNMRQPMFDAAYKYSSKIICCDTDEYLDGAITKEELEQLLDDTPGTNLNLQWIQYTGKNQIRVDGPWGCNFKVRAGSYIEKGDLGNVQMHSLHIPDAGKSIMIDPERLFIAHLQWLSKRWVGVKQYFWKINDYVNSTVHGAEVVGGPAYDVSVNNFKWLYDEFSVDLKVDENIYEQQDMKDNYKLEIIKRYTKELDIPNLGDWGMGIYDYVTKDS
jgi:hypothetical protein